MLVASGDLRTRPEHERDAEPAHERLAMHHVCPLIYANARAQVSRINDRGRKLIEAAEPYGERAPRGPSDALAQHCGVYTFDSSTIRRSYACSFASASRNAVYLSVGTTSLSSLISPLHVMV